MGEQECRKSLRKKVEESQIQNDQCLVFPGKSGHVYVPFQYLEAYQQEDWNLH